jgi:hypothetical protein
MQIAGRAGRYKSDGFVSAFTFDTLNTIRKVLKADKNVTNNYGGKYKEVVKQTIKDGQSSEKVEINIDEFQNSGSDDDYDEFVTVADVEEDNSEHQYDFEVEEGKTEYVIDHKFSSHQKNIKKAVIFPMFSLIEKFSDDVFIQTGKRWSYSQILKLFCSKVQLGDIYEMRSVDDYYLISKELDRFTETSPFNSLICSSLASTFHHPMHNPSHIQYHFCQLPVRITSQNQTQKLAIIKYFYSTLLSFREVPLPGQDLVDYSILKVPIGDIEEEELGRLEDLHNTLEMYIWLGNKYPQEFIELNQAVELIKHIAHLQDTVIS